MTGDLIFQAYCWHTVSAKYRRTRYWDVSLTGILYVKGKASVDSKYRWVQKSEGSKVFVIFPGQFSSETAPLPLKNLSPIHVYPKESMYRAPPQFTLTSPKGDAVTGDETGEIVGESFTSISKISMADTNGLRTTSLNWIVAFPSDIAVWIETTYGANVPTCSKTSKFSTKVFSTKTLKTRAPTVVKNLISQTIITVSKT